MLYLFLQLLGLLLYQSYLHKKHIYFRVDLVILCV
jgi:hypothetical protein